MIYLTISRCYGSKKCSLDRVGLRTFRGGPGFLSWILVVQCDIWIPNYTTEEGGGVISLGNCLNSGQYFLLLSFREGLNMEFFVIGDSSGALWQMP